MLIIYVISVHTKFQTQCTISEAPFKPLKPNMLKLIKFYILPTDCMHLLSTNFSKQTLIISVQLIQRLNLYARRSVYATRYELSLFA
jgi:hypothetical protein